MSTNDVTMTFAECKTTGELVDIGDVKNGIACNCICLCCGSDLIAKKGFVLVHHFAHFNSESCLQATETAAHRIAKEVICEYGLRFPIINYNHELAANIDELEEINGTHIFFDSVQVEKKVDDFIPDIIGIFKGRKFLIEIAVTHFVDKEKLKKLQTTKIPTIEIDLSSAARLSSKNDVIEAIKNIDSYRTKWLVTPSVKKDIRKQRVAESRAFFEDRFKYDFERGINYRGKFELQAFGCIISTEKRINRSNNKREPMFVYFARIVGEITESNSFFCIDDAYKWLKSIFLKNENFSVNIEGGI